MEVFQEFSFWLWNMLEFKNYFTLIKFKTCLLFLGGDLQTINKNYEMPS